MTGPATGMGQGKCQQLWSIVVYIWWDGQNASWHDWSYQTIHRPLCRDWWHWFPEINILVFKVSETEYSTLIKCVCLSDIYTVSQKNIPNIFNCIMKTNDQILIIFGTNIPDTTCHQMTVQFLSLIHIWRCRRIERCRSRWSPYH